MPARALARGSRRFVDAGCRGVARGRQGRRRRGWWLRCAVGPSGTLPGGQLQRLGRPPVARQASRRRQRRSGARARGVLGSPWSRQPSRWRLPQARGVGRPSLVCVLPARARLMHARPPVVCLSVSPHVPFGAAQRQVCVPFSGPGTSPGPCTLAVYFVGAGYFGRVLLPRAGSWRATSEGRGAHRNGPRRRASRLCVLSGKPSGAPSDLRHPEIPGGLRRLNRRDHRHLGSFFWLFSARNRRDSGDFCKSMA